MKEEEHSRVTSRPYAADTARPGECQVSLEDYVSLIGSTCPPRPEASCGPTLDELVAEILDEHKTDGSEQRRALEDVLDEMDSLWGD